MTATTASRIRVLIADDHAMILEMLQLYLRDVPDIEVAVAADLPQALAKIEQEGPYDLALLDLNMPGMNGVAGLQAAIAVSDDKPVGVLTSDPSREIVDEIVRAGAAGILLKSASLKNFANEIRFMAGGARYLPIELVGSLSPAAAATPASAPKPVDAEGSLRSDRSSTLSRREFEVLELLAEGKMNREIGAALSLAEPTVKMHVKSICKKLGVHTRTQAAIVARDKKLI